MAHPPTTPPGTLGIVLLQGPRGALFVISKVPLYALPAGEKSSALRTRHTLELLSWHWSHWPGRLVNRGGKCRATNAPPQMPCLRRTLPEVTCTRFVLSYVCLSYMCHTRPMTWCARERQGERGRSSPKPLDPRGRVVLGSRVCVTFCTNGSTIAGVARS